jgi:hypothetical protein
MEDHQTAHDMIDVTDCLEARDAFRAMKNFCFWVMLICLLLLQGLFWFQQSGGIGDQKVAPPSVKTEAATAEKAAAEPVSHPAPEVSAASSASAPEPVPVPADTQKPAEPIVQAAKEVAQELQSSQNPEEKESKFPAFRWPPFRLATRHAWVLVSALNAVLLFAAVLYSLVLVFILKVSLVSRLGGISHISRAFFISLFLLMLLFPWQRLVPGVLLGTIYLPSELLCIFPSKSDGSTLWKVLTYLRFVGLWIPAVWLLLWSAIRSGKWYQTTQRRLGIVA